MVIDYLLGHSLTGGDVAVRVREEMGEETPPLLLLSSSLESVPQPEIELFDVVLAKATELPVIVRTVLRLKRRTHTRLVSPTPEEIAERKANDNTPV